MSYVSNNIRQRLAPYPGIVIWGASGLARTALARWLPAEKIRLIVDGDPQKHGQHLRDHEIHAPSAIAAGEWPCVVICTNAHEKVRRELQRMHYPGEIFYIYDLFLPADGADKLTELQKLSIDIAATRNAPIVEFLFMKPQILVNVSFRFARATSGSALLLPAYLLFFVLHAVMCVVFSIQLPIGTSIGPGLVFAHYGTIVFTQRAKIGSFFTIYHGCTVGTDDRGRGPEIGNFVTQFAGAHVLGACKIGNNVRIGANAVVIDTDAPSGGTLVGIPARIAAARQDL